MAQALFPDLSVEEAGREIMKRDHPPPFIDLPIKPWEITDSVAFGSSPRAFAVAGAALRGDGAVGAPHSLIP